MFEKSENNFKGAGDGPFYRISGTVDDEPTPMTGSTSTRAASCSRHYINGRAITTFHKSPQKNVLIQKQVPSCRSCEAENSILGKKVLTTSGKKSDHNH